MDAVLGNLESAKDSSPERSVRGRHKA
jgi:hypothetical protein